MDGRIIAIAGGIGSGKSVVQAILKAMGYSVYDCDSRAKELMDTDPHIISEIREEICPDAVVCDRIDRGALADRVFNNAEALGKLNMLVHREVISDVRRWRSGKPVSFVETAILCTSGLDREVNEVWLVTAPEDLRLARVKSRNPRLTETQILKRIEAQKEEIDAVENLNARIIINDGKRPLLPRIEELLTGFRD